MKKKIGLVSECAEFTRGIAEGLSADGFSYMVFSELAKNWLCTRAKKPKTFLKGALLPAVSYLKGADIPQKIIMLDMDTLIHDEAVAAIKSDFELVWLKDDFGKIKDKANGAERALHTEYTKQLSGIYDSVVDFSKLGYKGGMKWLTEKLS